MISGETDGITANSSAGVMKEGDKRDVKKSSCGEEGARKTACGRAGGEETGMRTTMSGIQRTKGDLRPKEEDRILL